MGVVLNFPKNSGDMQEWSVEQIREHFKLPEIKRPKMIPCLCCRKKFLSEWKFNRMCQNCSRRGHDYERGFE